VDLAGKPGEMCTNGEKQDDQIVFQNLTFYPKVGQYATKEETEDALIKFNDKSSILLKKSIRPATVSSIWYCGI
jgi:hypothetical protein